MTEPQPQSEPEVLNLMTRTDELDCAERALENARSQVTIALSHMRSILPGGHPAMSKLKRAENDATSALTDLGHVRRFWAKQSGQAT